MLNKYMWQLYLNAGGDKIVKRFEDNFTGGLKKDYADMITELHKNYFVSSDILTNEHEQLFELCEFFSDNNDPRWKQMLWKAFLTAWQRTAQKMIRYLKNLFVQLHITPPCFHISFRMIMFRIISS